MIENRIGSERVRLRMTQTELASKLGVSNKTISSWERDIAKCPYRNVLAMSTLFGCTTDYLLGHSNRHFDNLSA